MPGNFSKHIVSPESFGVSCANDCLSGIRGEVREDEIGWDGMSHDVMNRKNS